MEFKSSKKVVIDSMMMIVFGFFVIIMPYIIGGQRGADKFSAGVGFLVIVLGVYFYNKSKRFKVVLHNDRIEYIGPTKNEDRTINFHNIYLIETIPSGGVPKTFIVDKYSDGNKMVIRGTNPPATEREIGRGRNINLNYKESLSIDSRRVENYEKLVYEISNKVARDRVGYETENIVKKYKGEKLPDRNVELSKEEKKRLNRIRLMFKTAMILNVFSLLILSVLIEGKSPIVNNGNTTVYLGLIGIYLINLVLNIWFILKSSMITNGNTGSVKAISYTGIVLSICVIIPLIVKLF